MACSLLLQEHEDLLRLIIQAIKNDLSGKNEIFQCLALVCIANVGGQEFAESLAPDVQKLLVAGYVWDHRLVFGMSRDCGPDIGLSRVGVLTFSPRPSPCSLSRASKASVRKKAALCLLRMFRKYPEIMSSDSWATRIINLLEDKHMGVVTSVLSLLLGLVAQDPQGYEDAVPKAIKLLTKVRSAWPFSQYFCLSLACA